MKRLRTSVIALPIRAVQRMAFSVPFGKKSKAMANRLGMKITSVISTISFSIMSAAHTQWSIVTRPPPRLLTRGRRTQEVRQHGEDADRRQNQKDDVIAQMPGLNVPQSPARRYGRVGQYVDGAVDHALVETPIGSGHRDCSVADRVDGAVDAVSVHGPAPVGDHQRRPHKK